MIVSYRVIFNYFAEDILTHFYIKAILYNKIIEHYQSLWVRVASTSQTKKSYSALASVIKDI